MSRDAKEILADLADVMAAVGQAVREGDVDALAGLVPRQEGLIREAGGIDPHCLEEPRAGEVSDLVRQVARQNTQNAILIQGQVALIRTMMRTIFPEGRSFDQLA